MSLQIWMPLNKSTSNIGLGGFSITHGTYAYGSGKVTRNAAQFDADPAKYFRVDAPQLQTNFSWCCWFNCVGSTSKAYQFILSQGRDYDKYGMNILICGTDLRIMYGLNSSATLCTISYNTWYHVAVCVSESDIKAYVNGVLVKTLPIITFDYTWSNGFVIGKMSYNYTSSTSYFPFNGLINDVRVYNNYLTGKQVKRIARGLMLKIGMCDRRVTNVTNLATGWDFENYAIGSNGGHTAQQGATVTITDEEHYFGTRCLKITSTNSTTGRSYRYITSGIKGKTYTVSMYFKCASSNLHTKLHVELYGGDYNWNSYDCLYTNKGKWQRLYCTFTLTSNTRIYVFPYNNNAAPAYIDAIQIEEGDSVYSAYTPTSYSRSIIYDSSGYKNNMSITSTGTTTVSIKGKDSPKFNSYYEFDGTNYLTGPSLFETNSEVSSLSICGWVKLGENYNKDNGVHLVSMNGSSGNSFIRMSYGKHSELWACCKYKKSDGSYGNQSIIINVDLTLNVWHFVCLTFNNGIFNYYVDGASPITLDYSSKFTKIYVYSSSQYTYINAYKQNSEIGAGALSDIRVYATALDNDAVTEIYKTRKI